MSLQRKHLHNLFYQVLDAMADLSAWIFILHIYALFYSEPVAVPSWGSVLYLSGIVLLTSAIVHNLVGIYKSLWRYSGLGSAIRLSAAVLISNTIIYLISFLTLGVWINPVMPLLAFYFSVSLSLLLRLHKRIFDTISLFIRSHLPSSREQGFSQGKKYRTLILGAGDTAYGFLRQEKGNPNSVRDFIYIIDNDFNKQGHSMQGIPIIGTDAKIPYIIQKYKINEVIIAIPNIPPTHLKRLMGLVPMDKCVTRRITAGLSDHTASSTVIDINIGDVLGREENLPDNALINGWIQDKTVLITGGGGSIGSEICNQLLKHDIEKLVIYDISENNVFNLMAQLSLTYGPQIKNKIILCVGSVQDETRLSAVFSTHKPDIVFHAAAYKHVPFMEESPRLAFNNNTIGTLLTARYAARHGVSRFVLVSTDKAVNPANVMGATKRLSELAVLGLNIQNTTEFVCVRFGNVLDSNGSVVPTFKAQIAAGGPITLTHPDITRYFMTIPEAAQLVLEAGAMAKGGEIFILDMGQPVKIKDLAENLILLSGLTPGVDIKIEISGLRPGEKLYEELLLAEEGLEKTPNNKIFVAHPPYPEGYHILIQMLLAYLRDDTDEWQVYRAIQQFVPEYLGTFPEGFATTAHSQQAN